MRWEPFCHQGSLGHCPSTGQTENAQYMAFSYTRRAIRWNSAPLTGPGPGWNLHLNWCSQLGESAWVCFQELGKRAERVAHVVEHLPSNVTPWVQTPVPYTHTHTTYESISRKGACGVLPVADAAPPMFLCKSYHQGRHWNTSGSF
jgi:hypothetical protein